MTDHTPNLPALRAHYEALEAIVDELMWRLDRIAVEELLQDVRDMVEGS